MWVSNLALIFFIVIVAYFKLGMSLCGFYVSEEDSIAPSVFYFLKAENQLLELMYRVIKYCSASVQVSKALHYFWFSPLLELWMFFPHFMTMYSGLCLHNILTASELAISVWGYTVWQPGPQGATSAGAAVQSAPAYLLGSCQLKSAHAWTSARSSIVQYWRNVLSSRLHSMLYRVKQTWPFILTTNLFLTYNEPILLEISIIYCIVHVTLLSANVQALSYIELSCGKMIIFCPAAVSPYSRR